MPHKIINYTYRWYKKNPYQYAFINSSLELERRVNKFSDNNGYDL